MTTKKLTASSTTKMPGPFTSIDIDEEQPPRRKPSDGSTSTDVNSFRQPKDGGLTFATWQFQRTSLMSILLSVMSAVGCVMNAIYDLLVGGGPGARRRARRARGDHGDARDPHLVASRCAFMRRWSDQRRAQVMWATTGGCTIIVVIAFEIRLSVIEPVANTLYHPQGMILIALVISTFGIDLRLQVLLALTFSAPGITANAFTAGIVCVEDETSADGNSTVVPDHPYGCVPTLIAAIVPWIMLQACVLALIVVYVLDAQARALYAQTQRALQQIDLEARAEARAQAEIAGYVFHELRNDQNAVAGVLEIVEQRQEQQDLPAEEAGMVRDARLHARHAAQVVTNMLDFTKLRAGELVLPTDVPFAVQALCEECCTLVSPLVSSTPVALRVACGERPPGSGSPARPST